jgi:hypothetical protein
MSFVLAHQNKNKAADSKTSMAPAKHSLHHNINNLAMDSHDSIIHLQRIIGNQAVQRLMRSNIGFDFEKIGIFQPKLKVSQPGDTYEREADRVAEQVLSIHMSDSTAPKNTSKEQGIDRKCSTCEMVKNDKGNENLDISRKPSSTSNLETTHQIANKINSTRSSDGLPLDPDIRRFMEPRIGHDFGNVRIHIDSNATESARSVGAQAYTVGRDIVFGSGQFSPHTSHGRRLLAHELTHVVQQSAGIAQGIQRQPIDAAQPSVVVQPSFADIDLQINQQGEEGAREIVTRGFGGENGLNDLFKSMPAVQKQVDADDVARDRAKLRKTMANINWAKDLKTLYYAQFLVRMRHYFGSWPALLDHFKDLTELSGSPGHFLHKSAARRLEGALRVLKRKSIRSLSNAFSLRGRYYGKVEPAGQMTHAMGYALDIAPSTNPALKQGGEKALEKSDTLHIATIIGESPRMDMDPELKKIGIMGDKNYGPNPTFIESMGKGQASEADTKKYFAIFEKEFRRMEKASKQIQISISEPNKIEMLKRRGDYFSKLIQLERNRNILEIERKKRSKTDFLEKLITDLEDSRIKILKEIPKFMTEWVAAIDAYIAKEEVVLKQNDLDVLRAPAVVFGDIKNIEKEVTKARKDLTRAQSSKARAMAERDAARAVAERDADSEQRARVEAAKRHSKTSAEIDKASERATTSRQIAYRKGDAVVYAAKKEMETRQELARITISRDALTDELKKSKLHAPKDRELAKKWENVTLLREHRKWLTTPDLKTPADVDDYERLIFGNLREAYTPKDLKQAGLKSQERLVNNPPLVRLVTEGFMNPIPGDFDLDFFKEMANSGFWPGATWTDPVDTMHFELVEGRKSINYKASL